MRRYLLIVLAVTIFHSYSFGTISFFSEAIATNNTFPNQKSKKLVEQKLKRVMLLSVKYKVTRDQIKQRKEFKSEEKKGSTYIITILDSETKKEINLFFDEWKPNAIRQAATLGSGDGFSLEYYADGSIERYYDVKGDKVDGIDVGFYDNGNLRYFHEIKDNNLLGVRMEWQSTGELLKYIEYKEPYVSDR